ncbi:MaoC/PaaZ C-terminal domain-containing protein [Streptomyces sp. NPDC051105]|uniref:MaoC/PaaZ C-terminal domain-containing protein n=1 Tax=Streptomyces sp. NPDC051105 TaxID=3154843 RepID=UPI00343B5FF5
MIVLSGPPALGPLLARGALRSPFKRPAADAPFPRTRLVLPDVRADVDRLAAYERVCGFATGDDGLPVTYPHVLGFPLAMRLMSARDFPLPLLGLVHTSVEIERYAELPGGGTYELRVHIAKLSPHRRGTEATVVIEARVGEDVVWASRSRYLARHRTTAVRGGPPQEGQENREGRGNREGWENREGREPLPVVEEWRIAGDVGRRYGAASGDRNPIHLHPLTARLFGFPRAVAHGMWTVARCLAAHGVPERARVEAEFRAPVLLPGTVAYAADGTGRFELRDPKRVHVEGRVLPLAT